MPRFGVDVGIVGGLDVFDLFGEFCLGVAAGAASSTLTVGLAVRVMTTVDPEARTAVAVFSRPRAASEKARYGDGGCPTK